LLKSTTDIVAPSGATSASVTASDNYSSTSPSQPAITHETESEQVDQDDLWEERLHSITSLKNRLGLPNDPRKDPNSPFFAANLQGHSVTQQSYQLGEIDFGNEDPEILLSIFRDEMSQYFPFVVVPPGILAKDLRRTRPSWYTAIMAVATRSSKQQVLLGNMVMQQLAERIVVNIERSIDLLLAILTYAGWFVSFRFVTLWEKILIFTGTTTFSSITRSLLHCSHWD
jgi:hypothetical protein